MKEFYRKVVPFLKAEYFEEQSERVIFEEIQDFSTSMTRSDSEVLIIQPQQIEMTSLKRLIKRLQTS